MYNATIKDRAFTYAIFFLFFCVHIIFCVWSAISPPLPFSNDWSHTGFICGIKAFGSNTFTGIVYVIGGSLWTLESLWSLWCLKGVSSPSCLALNLIIGGLFGCNHGCSCTSQTCFHAVMLRCSGRLAKGLIVPHDPATGVPSVQGQWRRQAPEAGGGGRSGHACRTGSSDKGVVVLFASFRVTCGILLAAHFSLSGVSAVRTGNDVEDLTV